MAGEPFNPGNYAFVGGNTKFYGAVLSALPRRGLCADCATSRAPRPAGRSATRSWSLGTRKPRQLYRVRGNAGEDPTEPPHSAPYPFTAGPGRARIARCAPPEAARASIRLSAAARASISTAGSRARRPPGTPSPTR